MLVSNGTESTRSTTIASNLFEYIVKSDKSASQIRNPRFQIGRTVMTQFENREFWFARNIPLLAEERWLRGQSRSREATFFPADGREARAR